MSGRNALILMCMTLATRTAGAAAVSAVQSPGGLILEDAGAGRARVASADRAAVEVALPAGAEVTALAEVGSGWLAGGTRPVASGGRRLWLLRGDGGGARGLAVPAPSPFAVQRRPVPLVEGSELAGLVWLE